jgi:hypothetical protein
MPKWGVANGSFLTASTAVWTYVPSVDWSRPPIDHTLSDGCALGVINDDERARKNPVR